MRAPARNGPRRPVGDGQSESPRDASSPVMSTQRSTWSFPVSSTVAVSMSEIGHVAGLTHVSSRRLSIGSFVPPLLRIQYAACRSRSNLSHFHSAVRDQISSLGLPKRSSSWQVPHDCGHNDSIDAGFFSHSPLAAQSGQAVSLSAHTVVHTPHVFGQSRMTAPGLFAHSVSPQIAHCVEFLSSHVVAWQTWHEPGQVFSVKPGFSWHCPAIAQPGQSLCVSLHSSRQTPQETGQCLSMKSGFSAHAPDEVQPAQSSCTSLHVGEHKPHDVGHAFSMKPAFLVQSPFLAHAGQDTSVSSHVRVQVPQECGQSSAKYSLFAPLHSPSFAQPAHELDLSLQRPAAETTATDAARSTSILADVLSPRARVICVCTRQTCFFVRYFLSGGVSWARGRRRARQGVARAGTNGFTDKRVPPDDLAAGGRLTLNT